MDAISAAQPAAKPLDISNVPCYMFESPVAPCGCSANWIAYAEHTAPPPLTCALPALPPLLMCNFHKDLMTSTIGQAVSELVLYCPSCKTSAVFTDFQPLTKE